MYEGPVGLLRLDPAAVPPAAGPFPGSPLAAGPQQQQRRSAALQAGGGATVVLGAGAAAGPGALRSGYRDEAPRSPQRNSDTAMSVFGRRSLLAAAGSSPTALAVLVPRGNAGCFGDDDGLVGESCDELLPSMVPSDLLGPASRVPSAASHGRRLNGDLPLPGSPRAQQQRRGSEALEALAASGGGSSGGMSCALTAGASLRPRDLPAVPASPTPNASGRSLRTSTGQFVGAGPLVPHPPPPQPASSAALAAAVSAGAALEPQPSYKSPVRRFRGASTAADCEDSAVGGVPGRICGSRSSVALREDNSSVLEGPSPRRSGLLAWAPSTDSAPASFAGVRSSHDRNQGVGVGFSRRPEDLPAAPNPANSCSLAGGSPGSTPGTTNGGGSGLPARPPSVLILQPSFASSGSASSSNGIGFSRRPEDLPAAPSPANSRALAGGGTGSRSGGSTPGSPAGGVVRFAQQLMVAAKAPVGGSGGGSVTTDQPQAQPAPYQHQPPQQPLQQAPLPQRHPEAMSGPESGSRGILASGSGAVGPTQPSPRQSAQFAPAPPSPRASYGAPVLLQRQQSIGFSRRPEDLPAAPSPLTSRSLAGGSPGSTPGTPNGGGGAPLSSRPPSAATSQASCMSVGSSSIGFSRRPEDLPAAPSPANSRSLVSGPMGGSAGSSLRSAGDAPQAAQSRWLAGLDNPSPRSPPVGAVGLSRRLDDLPPAASPAASRSLRPDSSRAAFRSHAAAGAGGGAGGGGGGAGARSAMTLATSPASPLRASGNGSSRGGGSGSGALWSPWQRERHSQQRELDLSDFAAGDGCTILEDYSDSD